MTGDDWVKSTSNARTHSDISTNGTTAVEILLSTSLVWHSRLHSSVLLSLTGRDDTVALGVDTELGSIIATCWDVYDT